METIVYAGLLSIHEYCHSDGPEDVLFLSSLKQPFAEVVCDEVGSRLVSCRYWITNKAATRDEAVLSTLKSLYGIADCDFGAVYSEITGFLWMNEKVEIGGHDLIQELKEKAGKYILIEFDVGIVDKLGKIASC